MVENKAQRGNLKDHCIYVIKLHTDRNLRIRYALIAQFKAKSFSILAVFSFPVKKAGMATL